MAIPILPHYWLALPTEPTERTLVTPAASAAVDIKNTPTFDLGPMDDSDEPWANETDHRTGRNKEFKSGTYRGMLYGIVLQDYPSNEEDLRIMYRGTRRSRSNNSVLRHG